MKNQTSSIKLIIAEVFLCLLLLPIISYAEVCGKIWDGDASRAYALNNKFQGINFDNTPISNKQLEVFYQAKEKISRIAGISPKFVICNDLAPNAFAMNRDGRDVIGVSLGMLNFANGDEDMAAAVIAHEVSHHTLGHRERGQSSQFALELVTGILGILADAAIQSRYNVQNSTIGRDLASVGSNLVSSKFSRDYEREADDNGFKYMVAAGYNPEGGLRLANTFIQKGFSTSSGWFNATHPGWDERADRYRTMIARANINTSNTVVAQNTKSESNNTLLFKELDVSTNQEISTKSEIKETISNSPAPIVELTKDEKYIQEAFAAIDKGDYLESIKNLKIAMKLGNGTAFLAMGSHYEFGLGVKKDINLAIKNYKLGLQKNTPSAYGHLGSLYLYDQSDIKERTPQTKLKLANKENIKKALGYFYEGEKYNDPLSLIYLANMYNEGFGVEKNLYKSLEYRNKLADLGDPNALEFIGLYWTGNWMEMFGLVQTPNKKLARDYLEKASVKNKYTAMAVLGRMYLYGDGIEKDKNKGLAFIENAASNKDGLANYYLSYAYFRGEVVPKDEIKSCLYAEEGAKTSDAYSLWMLGICYWHGVAFKEDKYKALDYIKKAADLGVKDAIDYLAKIGER